MICSANKEKTSKQTSNIQGRLEADRLEKQSESKRESQRVHETGVIHVLKSAGM